jgi:hypothetical protein
LDHDRDVQLIEAKSDLPPITVIGADIGMRREVPTTANAATMKRPPTEAGGLLFILAPHRLQLQLVVNEQCREPFDSEFVEQLVN